MTPQEIDLEVQKILDTVLGAFSSEERAAPWSPDWDTKILTRTEEALRAAFPTLPLDEVTAAMERLRASIFHAPDSSAVHAAGVRLAPDELLAAFQEAIQRVLSTVTPDDLGSPDFEASYWKKSEALFRASCPDATDDEVSATIVRARAEMEAQATALVVSTYGQDYRAPTPPSPAELEVFYQELLCRGRVRKNTHPKGPRTNAWTAQERFDFGFQLASSFSMEHPDKLLASHIGPMIQRMCLELNLEDCQDPLRAAEWRAELSALRAQGDTKPAPN